MFVIVRMLNLNESSKAKLPVATKRLDKINKLKKNNIKTKNEFFKTFFNKIVRQSHHSSSDKNNSNTILFRKSFEA